MNDYRKTLKPEHTHVTKQKRYDTPTPVIVEAEAEVTCEHTPLYRIRLTLCGNHSYIVRALGLEEQEEASEAVIASLGQALSKSTDFLCVLYSYKFSYSYWESRNPGTLNSLVAHTVERWVPDFDNEDLGYDDLPDIGRNFYGRELNDDDNDQWQPVDEQSIPLYYKNVIEKLEKLFDDAIQQSAE